jgi:hypothetical protein
VTLEPFSCIATPCLLARPRSELRQRLVHLTLKPTPIHIGRWRPEPSQNLRHLAARKTRPERRAALGLIHRHRHDHHPFAAACAYDGSLTLARAYRQPHTRALRSLLTRASTTKLSRRSCRRRARQRAAAPRGDRYVVRPTGAWSCSRPLSMHLSLSNAHGASRRTTPRYRKCGTSGRLRRPSDDARLGRAAGAQVETAALSRREQSPTPRSIDRSLAPRTNRSSPTAPDVPFRARRAPAWASGARLSGGKAGAVIAAEHGAVHHGVQTGTHLASSTSHSVLLGVWSGWFRLTDRTAVVVAPRG